MESRGKMKVGVVRMAVAALCAAALLTGAHALDGEAATGSTAPINGSVTVGTLVSLTGTSSSGEEAEAAINLGISDFNAYLSEMGAGWQMETISRDTATDPEVAREAIRALHEEEDITVILGPVTSANVDAVREYVDQNGMISLSCCSSAPALAIPDDGVYRLVPDDSGQGVALSKVLEEAGIDALVTIWRGDAYGDGVWMSVSDEFEERGGVVYAGIRYSPHTPEMSQEVALLNEYVKEAIVRYGADRVAVIMISFEESRKIARAAIQYDVLDDVRWFASESVTLDSGLPEDGTASTFAESVGLTAAEILLTPGERHGYVREAMTADLGREPSVVVYTAYDSAWMVGLAMIEAGSTEASYIGEALQAVAAGYDGAIRYDGLNEAGDLLPTAHKITRLVDGAWVQVGTYLAETDTLAEN